MTSKITHGPKRIWWKPWRVRCRCRWPFYPCYDVVPLGVELIEMPGQISDRLRGRRHAG